IKLRPSCCQEAGIPLPAVACGCACALRHELRMEIRETSGERWNLLGEEDLGARGPVPEGAAVRIEWVVLPDCREARSVLVLTIEAVEVDAAQGPGFEGSRVLGLQKENPVVEVSCVGDTGCALPLGDVAQGELPVAELQTLTAGCKGEAGGRRGHREVSHAQDP